MDATSRRAGSAAWRDADRSDVTGPSRRRAQAITVRPAGRTGRGLQEGRR